MRWNVEFLNSLNEGERSLVNWQYNMMGGFESALWDAIKRADEGNLARLALGFPEHVEAYINYASVNGWWTSFQRQLFKVDDVQDHG